MWVQTIGFVSVVLLVIFAVSSFHSPVAFHREKIARDMGMNSSPRLPSPPVPRDALPSNRLPPGTGRSLHSAWGPDCEGYALGIGASCPEPMDWLPAMAETFPRGDWLHVDVGANKGYGVLNFVAALSGEEFSTPKKLQIDLRKAYWHKLGKLSGAIRTWRRKQFCGMCCDCMKDLDSLPERVRARSVHAYAIDLSPTTADWLKNFFTGNSHVTTVHAGVSKEAGYRDVMPPLFAGDEMVSLKEGSKVEVPVGGPVLPVRTKVLPLSQIIPEGSHIDFLSTDTEGFDRHVFEGARDLFVQKRVSVYVFEVAFHLLPQFQWNGTYLTDFVTELSSLGYACMLPTGRASDADTSPMKQYIRLGPQCRPGAIEGIVGWFNVLCYNHDNITLRQVFQEKIADRPRKDLKVPCPKNW